MAKQLARTFGAIGIKHTLEQLNPENEKPQLPQTYLEALKALVASEEERVRLEHENVLLQTENNILEIETERQAEIIDELFDYSSIIRIAKYNNVDEKTFRWRRLKAASLQLGIEIKKAPCPRYVTKNLYHHDVWRVAYPDISLPETTTIRVQN